MLVRNIAPAFGLAPLPFNFLARLGGGITFRPLDHFLHRFTDE